MFCSKCGNEVEEGTAFCPKCGTELGDSKVKSDTSKSKFASTTEKISLLKKVKSWSLKKKIIIGAGIVLLFILLVSMCSGGSSGGKHTVKYLRSMNTEAARNWADLIEEYGIDAVDENNMTILQTAVGSDNGELVAACIKDKADVNRKGSRTAPALIMAVRQCNYDITKQLLEAGAVVNPKYEKDTSLYAAFDENEFDALFEVLKWNAGTLNSDSVTQIALLLIPYYQKNGLLDHFDDGKNALCRTCYHVNNNHQRVDNMTVLTALFEAGYQPSQGDIGNWSEGLIGDGFYSTDGEVSKTSWNILTKVLKQKQYKEKYAELMPRVFNYSYSKGTYSEFLSKTIQFISFLLDEGYDPYIDGSNPQIFIDKLTRIYEEDYDAEVLEALESAKKVFVNHGIAVQ